MERIDKNGNTQNDGKKFQPEHKDCGDVDAETAILQILARNNRNRLFEKLEHTHLKKTKSGNFKEGLDYNLRSLYKNKLKKYGRRNENYRTLFKRKQRKRQSEKNLKFGYQDLYSQPLTTYGTFFPYRVQPHIEGSSKSMSVYEPHQLKWSSTMFYQNEQNHHQLLKNGIEYSNLTHPLPSQPVHYEKVENNGSVEDLEVSSGSGKARYIVCARSCKKIGIK